ncbi:ABC transporter ATP-binding protein [Chondromyces apiculatus]|uniref:ABC-type multidrug transport system, ATPase component n=1 Tax=Chondromyces apiculatus DSM 436 TaxID=1192034 RepID=A0A017T0F8_9BACT|nr:ABC transporter ATP-binding protein [Chondromyces apiculatus]EYF02021.1 ABC-type multidrug transport system, ATPase component [Chondromyces apiculatus DSM 436]
MIEVEHLSKQYGAHLAVDDISFKVDRGEIVGFLGPNGAGKSTTLRILAGFLGATRGRVRVAGYDLAEEPMKARASLGYMPETSPLYPEMRVSEYLTFRAELKLVPRGERRAAVARAMRDAGVEHVAATPIGQLSKGYRQRVGLADALVSDPPLLILDEPTAGLDPNQIREVRALVQRLGQDRTILLSTHILSEVEATCTRALVIARGRLVAEGTIEQIRAIRRPPALHVAVRGDADLALTAASAAPGVHAARTAPAPDPSPDPSPEPLLGLEIDIDPGAEAGQVTEDVVRALVEAGVGVRAITPRTESLEQVFSELTAGDPAPSAAASPPSTAASPAAPRKNRKVKR